jgi:hypothetical protein
MASMCSTEKASHQGRGGRNDSLFEVVLVPEYNHRLQAAENPSLSHQGLETTGRRLVSYGRG